MALGRRKKRDTEYHTGRLNISCSPTMKDSIAADATAAGKSISQYMLDLYDQSTKAGTSEHTARLGLELVGMKKSMVNIDTQLRRNLSRSQGTVDAEVAESILKLRELEEQIDAVLKETLITVKSLKSEGK